MRFIILVKANGNLFAYLNVRVSGYYYEKLYGLISSFDKYNIYPIALIRQSANWLLYLPPSIII